MMSERSVGDTRLVGWIISYSWGFRPMRLSAAEMQLSFSVACCFSCLREQSACLLVGDIGCSGHA